MTLQEIKQAIADNKSVFWMNENYQVKRGSHHYLIMCQSGQSALMLTKLDGVTLNGAEKDFYIKPE